MTKESEVVLPGHRHDQCGAEKEPLPPTSEEPWGEDLYDGEYEGGGIGCYNCSDGWRHSCCDDLCRSCNEACDCEDGGIPCRNCNPDGDAP